MSEEEKVLSAKKSHKRKKIKKKNLNRKPKIVEKNIEDLIKLGIVKEEDKDNIKKIASGGQKDIFLLKEEEGEKVVEKVISVSKTRKTEKTKQKYDKNIEDLKEIQNFSVLPQDVKYIKNYRVETYDYMGNDLHDLYLGNKSGEKLPILEIIGQLIIILKKLNEKSIVHGDIKLSNFFIKNKKLILGDYNNVSFIGENKKRISKADNDLVYSSKETIREGYNKNSDLYSASLMMIELLTGRTIFSISKDCFAHSYTSTNEYTISFNKENLNTYYKYKAPELIKENIKAILPEIKNDKKQEQIIQLMCNIINDLINPPDNFKMSDLEENYLKLLSFIKEAGLDTGVSEETLNELSEKEQEKENNSEEQKNEKSANKIPNMNFITPQKYNEEQFKNNLPIQSEENISSPEFDLGTNSKNNGMELKASDFDEVKNLNNDKETKQEISIESGNEETKDETKENNIVVNNKQTIEKSENKQKTLKDKFDNFKTRFINSCIKLNEQTKKNNEIIKNFFTRKKTKNLLDSLINTSKDLGQESELQI